MKALIDLVMLSIAFWLAAAKLFLYFHPIETPQAADSQVWEQVEERPNPEVQSILDKTSDEIIKAKIDKDQAEQKAKEAAAKISSIELAKIDADKKASELEDAKKETEKKLEEVRVQSERNLAGKTLAEKEAAAAKQSEEQLRKEKEILDQRVKELEAIRDKEQENSNKAAEEKEASDKRRQEMEQELKKQKEPSDKIFETELVRHWSSNLEEAKRQSVRTNTPVFVAFEGESCSVCKALSKYVYSNSKVSPILRGQYIPVWMYCENNEVGRMAEFQKPHPGYTFPYCVVIKPNGSWNSFTPKFDDRAPLEVNIETFLNDLHKATIN